MNDITNKKIFYGRRRGKKISSFRSSLIENYMQNFEMEKPIKKINPLDLFKNKNPVWLEIGFGEGRHTFLQAKNNPDINFIASEVYEPGVASLLAYLLNVHDAGCVKKPVEMIKNVKIYPSIAEELIPFIKSKSIEKIFLMFPDPWRKNRHTQRRFFNNDHLESFYKILKDDGELRVATDDITYQDWINSHIPNSLFELVSTEKDETWYETKYEQKAQVAGRTCIYYKFRKL